MGENIGAAARAARNFGITRLRLVTPRAGSWPSEAATAMASGALGRMEPVGVFGTLAQAVADCHQVYAATARRREIAKPAMTPAGAGADIRARAGQATALVFGAEREGLTNAEIARAQALVHIETAPDFSSLNLAQAVIVAAHAWATAPAPGAPPPPEEGRAMGGSDPANQADLEGFFSRLEGALEGGHFFRSPEMRPTIARNIRACLTRAGPSAQEVRTWHGIVTALTGGKAPL